MSQVRGLGGQGGSVGVGVRLVKRTEAGEDGPEGGASPSRPDGVGPGPGELGNLVLLLPPGGGVEGLGGVRPHQGRVISLQVVIYPPPGG